MKTLLFCLVIFLVLFSASEASHLKAKAKVRATAQALRPVGGQDCHFEESCYWTDIPGLGEEEICDQVQRCDQLY